MLKKQTVFYGINAGFNSSRLYNDSLNLSYGTKPAIGFFWKNNLHKNFFIKISALYSIKGSTCAIPYRKLENSYLDLNFVPQYNFSKDFFLTAGISYSQFLNSALIRTSGESLNGTGRYWNGIFSSEINIVSGLELKLRDNFTIEFNGYIPTQKQNTVNFQLSAGIFLGSKKETHYRKKKKKATKEINELKEGTLLVRLKASENKINALITSGEKEKAEEVRLKQEEENKKIVSAFKQSYTFSKVVFFFNNKSTNIRSNDFKNIFLNDRLMEDSTITIDSEKPIFIAEFAQIEQDTASYLSHSDYEPSGNWNIKKENHYYGGPNFGFDALIIRDRNFVQLNKPFPYYERAIFNSIRQYPEQVLFELPILFFQNWSYDQAIKKMNNKLNRFYRSVNK